VPSLVIVSTGGAPPFAPCRAMSASTVKVVEHQGARSQAALLGLGALSERGCRQGALAATERPQALPAPAKEAKPFGCIRQGKSQPDQTFRRFADGPRTSGLLAEQPPGSVLRLAWAKDDTLEVSRPAFPLSDLEPSSSTGQAQHHRPLLLWRVAGALPEKPVAARATTAPLAWAPPSKLEGMAELAETVK